jgi:hypothetical protein
MEKYKYIISPDNQGAVLGFAEQNENLWSEELIVMPPIIQMIIASSHMKFYSKIDGFPPA